MHRLTYAVNIFMIRSFKNKSAEDLYHGIESREALMIPQNIWKTAYRKLDLLNSAETLQDLTVPPANRLQALKGSLRGFFSIRINDQYRLIFRFQDGHAYEVEIVDYH